MTKPLSNHPLADIFPLLDGDDYQRLLADIRQHGQIEPITIHDGMILDGRNRYRACVELGKDPYTIDYEGQDPLSFVLSLNLHRRHLSESQRAMVAARIANLGHGGSRRADQGANLRLDVPTPPNASVRAMDAAKMLSVSERSVDTARAVQRGAAPEIIKAVDAGSVAISAAAHVARLPIAEQQAVAAAGDKAIADKARELREAKKQPEAAPLSNVVQLAPRQPTLPTFSEIEDEGEAQEAADEVRDGPEIDLDTLEGRAHAFNGALSTLDIIAITGREYWSVFCKDPAKTVYESWVRSAHSKLTDIVKELDNARNTDATEPQGDRKRKGVPRSRA